MIRSEGLLASHSTRQGKNGPIQVKVPITAAETLSEGEFNRFYIRGLCARAIEDGVDAVIVYRARVSTRPRPESEARIGTPLSPAAVLQDLRQRIGTDTALAVPGGVNSGLSVRLPLADGQ